MQFQRVAEELYARGYNVLVPRLPHHGHANRLTNALAYLNSDELKAFAQETLSIARGFGEQVTIAGFSLGGLLAAWIGQYEPVERIVAISPSLDLGIVPSGLSRYVTNAMLRYPNFSSWINPIRRQRRPPEHTYPRYSSHALAHIYFFGQELFEAARTSAPRAKNITVITNKHDLTISNPATAKLIDLWRAKRNGDIETYEFADLPISHDIVDPLRHRWIAQRVHPKLLELLHCQSAS
jgi:carboxylesterase